MVVYEVNLSINESIYPKYYHWLIPHIDELLKIDGFLNAEVGIIEQPHEEGKKGIRVNYTLASHDHLQHYLTHHAPTMRAESIALFGDQFKAHRRIITIAS